MFGHSSELIRFFVHKISHDLGIVPQRMTGENMMRGKLSTALDKLPPEEAKKMKRKFRKLWRTEMKRELKRVERRSTRAPAYISEMVRKQAVKAVKRRYVTECCTPTRRQEQHRRLAVAMMIASMASTAAAELAPKEVKGDASSE